MSSQSFVSVIIIFYNAEYFIQEAIESVFAQTHKDWEILLVDDGSTDESTEIAQRYASQYSDRVHYLEHPSHQNQGMSMSRNLGIGQAKANLIAFLDADDVWLPHKLERQVAILASQPQAAMIYGETEYWFSWTGSHEDHARDYVQRHGIEARRLYEPPILLPLYLRGKAAIPTPSSIMVRRDALEEVGGFEASFGGMYEDQAFYAKLCLVKPVFVSDEYLDRYRQHPDSISYIITQQGALYKARLIFLNWLAAYLSENRVMDSEVWQALCKEFWLNPQQTLLNSPASAYGIVRWTKKWLLKIEERFVPATLRHFLWSWIRNAMC